MSDDSFEANLDTLSELNIKDKGSSVHLEAEKVGNISPDNPVLQQVAASSSAIPEAEAAAERALLTSLKHNVWKESRFLEKFSSLEGITIEVPEELRDLETIFGPGAAQHQMAIEYSGKEGGVCSERIIDSKSVIRW